MNLHLKQTILISHTLKNLDLKILPHLVMDEVSDYVMSKNVEKIPISNVCLYEYLKDKNQRFLKIFLYSRSRFEKI